MKGVDTVVHLAGVERQSSRANLAEVDIEGTQNVANAAFQAGVRRFFYLSHLGADKASAYPVLKAKALAEGAVIQSGVPYTIFRSSVLYGPGDQFTTGIARLARMSPIMVLLPGEGSTLLQPLWVEDLVTAMTIAMDDESMVNQVYPVAGAEYLSFRQVVEIILKVIGVRRKLLAMSPAYLRMLALWLEQPLPNPPLSLFWLDYLSADRTCPLDTLPRLFGLMPARFHQQLGYLTVEDEKKRK